MALPDNLRLCEDSDLLDYEPDIKTTVPPDRYSWDVARKMAVREIDRRLRARKSTGEPVEIARVGIRGREILRPVATQFALHFLYMRADQGDVAGGYVERRAKYYLARGNAMLEDETLQLDYDTNNDGTVDTGDKNQPFQRVFVRG